MHNTQQLLPEWYPQEAVILAWPDEHTDWAPWLDEVRQTYRQLIEAINNADAGVILLVRPTMIDDVRAALEGMGNVLLVGADYNDTWVRDYGFLTCQSPKGMQPIEFTFNGWGNKFNAAKDNRINQSVLAELCQLPLKTFSQVVEGGALEIDEQGNLLSTQLCLLNPERNGDMSLDAYKQLFTDSLGAESVYIFTHGHLEGDDTDGHVDTLVRFTPDKGIVVQGCENRQQDSHYEGLHALVNEVQQAFPEHEVFSLPLPNINNEDSERLPASYANYLITNSCVLCPVYQQPEDDEALAVLAQAYPNHRIVPINGLPLVQQFGSVHCISMQVPKSTLKPHIREQLLRGVTVYG